MSEPIRLEYIKLNSSELGQFDEMVQSSSPGSSIFTFTGLGILEILVRGKACTEYSEEVSRSFFEAFNESKQYLTAPDDAENFDAVETLARVIFPDNTRTQVNEWLHGHYMKQSTENVPYRLTQVLKKIISAKLSSNTMKSEILGNNLKQNTVITVLNNICKHFKVCLYVYKQSQPEVLTSDPKSQFPIIYLLEKPQHEYCLLRHKAHKQIDERIDSSINLMVDPFVSTKKIENNEVSFYLPRPQGNNEELVKGTPRVGQEESNKTQGSFFRGSVSKEESEKKQAEGQSPFKCGLKSPLNNLGGNIFGGQNKGVNNAGYPINPESKVPIVIKLADKQVSNDFAAGKLMKPTTFENNKLGPTALPISPNNLGANRPQANQVPNIAPGSNKFQNSDLPFPSPSQLKVNKPNNNETPPNFQNFNKVNVEYPMAPENKLASDNFPFKPTGPIQNPIVKANEPNPKIPFPISGINPKNITPPNSSSPLNIPVPKMQQILGNNLNTNKQNSEPPKLPIPSSEKVDSNIGPQVKPPVLNIPSPNVATNLTGMENKSPVAPNQNDNSSRPKVEGPIPNSVPQNSFTQNNKPQLLNPNANGLSSKPALPNSNPNNEPKVPYLKQEYSLLEQFNSKSSSNPISEPQQPAPENKEPQLLNQFYKDLSTNLISEPQQPVPENKEPHLLDQFYKAVSTNPNSEPQILVPKMPQFSSQTNPSPNLSNQLNPSPYTNPQGFTAFLNPGLNNNKPFQLPIQEMNLNPKMNSNQPQPRFPPEPPMNRDLSNQLPFKKFNEVKTQPQDFQNPSMLGPNINNTEQPKKVVFSAQPINLDIKPNFNQTGPSVPVKQVGSGITGPEAPPKVIFDQAKPFNNFPPAPDNKISPNESPIKPDPLNKSNMIPNPSTNKDAWPPFYNPNQAENPQVNKIPNDQPQNFKFNPTQLQKTGAFPNFTPPLQSNPQRPNPNSAFPNSESLMKQGLQGDPSNASTAKNLYPFTNQVSPPVLASKPSPISDSERLYYEEAIQILSEAIISKNAFSPLLSQNLKTLCGKFPYFQSFKPITSLTGPKNSNNSKTCSICKQLKDYEEFQIITCGDTFGCLVCSACRVEKTNQGCPVCKRIYSEYENSLLSTIKSSIIN